MLLAKAFTPRTAEIAGAGTVATVTSRLGIAAAEVTAAPPATSIATDAGRPRNTDNGQSGNALGGQSREAPSGGQSGSGVNSPFVTEEN